MTTHMPARSATGTPRNDVRGTAGLGSRDLPRVPRRYGQWAGAALFVLVAVLIAGWLWQQKSDRQEILVVASPVPAGAILTAGDLRIALVAGVDAAIGVQETESVVGATAAVALVDGQILTRDMVTADPLPGPGERVIGLQLDATRAPSGLRAGDAVMVLAVPPAGDPSSPEDLDDPVVLADEATVASAIAIEGAGSRLTLVVADEVAERVAAYVAAGRVALVQAPVGGDG